MSSGQFFELREAYPQGVSMQQYIYKATQTPETETEIYVLLRGKMIEFHFSAVHSYEQTRLFLLHLAQPTNPQGRLVKQLNFIKELNKHEVHLAEPAAAATLNFNPKPRNDCDFSSAGIFDRNGQKLGHEAKTLCFPTLLLDFLFDLYHSDLFRESPHYHQILSAIDGNPLFQAIVAKAQFYYYACQHKHFQNPIVKDNLLTAGEELVAILTDPARTLLLGKSPWFDDLEMELMNVISDMRKVEYESQMGRKDDLINLAVSWNLSRLSYHNAFTILHQSSKNYLLPLVLALAIPLFVAIWFFYPTWIFAAILLVVLITTSFMLWAKLSSYPPPQPRNVISMLMPRLTLSIFTSWLTLYFLAMKKIPEFDWIQTIIFFLVALILVFVYLMKEARTLAPEIEESRKIILRGGTIILWSLVVSGLLGAILISYSLQFQQGQVGFMDDSLIRVGGDNGWQFALRPWLNGTIFAFYSGLFISLLFKGQKFTGF